MTKDEHSPHSAAPAYSQEFKDRTEWIWTDHEETNLRKRIVASLKGHHGHHSHPYDVAQFDSLPLDQQVPRVVFALEKLAAFNKHAFREKDLPYFVPSNIGLSQRLFHLSLWAANWGWLFSIFAKRNFAASNLRNFGLFTLLHFVVLRPLPQEFKERVRYWRASRKARQMIAERKGDLSFFKRIIDPRTTSEALHHMKLE